DGPGRRRHRPRAEVGRARARPRQDPRARRGFAVTRGALLMIFLGACAGSELEARTSTVDEQIATARDDGAVRCAPVELAMAESHNEFAKTELRQGHYYPAKDQLAIAEDN